jgi:hypothetical protein
VTERRSRRPAGARLVRLYPRSWRERYEAEILAVLEEMPAGRRARLDLVRGAIDARLHSGSRAPAAAAIISGGLWTIAGVTVVGQPAPPDWPGYTVDVLPLATAAVLAGLVAIVGCWARRSDSSGRAGTAAVLLAVAGHVGWVVSLFIAMLNGGSGLAIAPSEAMALIGCVAIGLLLVRTDDFPIGAAILLASATMLFGWPIAWLGFGLAWTIVGALLFTRPEPSLPTPRLA